MGRLWVLILLLIAPAGRAEAFPTSSNLIPTADMLETGSLRLEFENDGAPGLFARDAENYTLLQYGVSSRLEAGIDLYSVGRSNQPLFNAKWLARTEGRRRPGLALGILEFGPGYSPTSYLIGAKDLGRGLRMHLGAAVRGDNACWLLGGELQVRKNDYLLADWVSWPDGYVSLGIYHELSAGVAVNLAYAWANTRGESPLLLLNVSRTTALGKAR